MPETKHKYLYNGPVYAFGKLMEVSYRRIVESEDQNKALYAVRQMYVKENYINLDMAYRVILSKDKISIVE